MSAYWELWGAFGEVRSLRINQHPVKSTSLRNCLASTFKLAEVSVDEVPASLTDVGWIKNVEGRVHIISDVVNKVVAKLGEGEGREDAR